MSRKGNCIDNGATEQVFGHMKDEFFRGRTWPDFESFKADLDAYVAHWNTRRKQVKLKGLTLEEFRSRSLVALERVRFLGHQIKGERCSIWPRRGSATTSSSR